MIRTHWKNLQPSEIYGVKVYNDDSDVIDCRDAYQPLYHLSWF